MSPSAITQRLRRETVPVSSSPTFARDCFGGIIRAQRTISAYERDDREGTLRNMNALFAYLEQRFPADPCASQTVLRLKSKPRKILVDEKTFPYVVSRMVLQTVPIDLAEVPAFESWANKNEKAVLAA